MLYGLVLLYVGAVLFINGIWLMGRITDREVAVINLFVGLLSLLVAVYLIFVVGRPKASRRVP
nr:AmiS/UreI family transporter [Pseudomonas putida]